MHLGATDADWVVPDGVSVQTVTGFEVVKMLGKRKPYPIYQGGDGATARDRFLHEKETNQPGITAMIQNGEVRDYWPRTVQSFAALRRFYPRGT